MKPAEYEARKAAIANIDPCNRGSELILAALRNQVQNADLLLKAPNSTQPCSCDPTALAEACEAAIEDDHAEIAALIERHSDFPQSRRGTLLDRAVQIDAGYSTYALSRRASMDEIEHAAKEYAPVHRGLRSGCVLLDTGLSAPLAAPIFEAMKEPLVYRFGVPVEQADSAVGLLQTLAGKLSHNGDGEAGACRLRPLARLFQVFRPADPDDALQLAQGVRSHAFLISEPLLENSWAGLGQAAAAGMPSERVTREVQRAIDQSSATVVPRCMALQQLLGGADVNRALQLSH